MIILDRFTSELVRINACVGTTGTSGKIFIEATGSTKPCIFSLASNTRYTGVLHRIRCATASGSSFFPILLKAVTGQTQSFL